MNLRTSVIWVDLIERIEGVLRDVGRSCDWRVLRRSDSMRVGFRLICISRCLLLSMLGVNCMVVGIGICAVVSLIRIKLVRLGLILSLGTVVVHVVGGEGPRGFVPVQTFNHVRCRTGRYWSGEG